LTASTGAYGLPLTISDEEILQHLLALNVSRSAEERRGLIRWPRPDYQIKKLGPLAHGADRVQTIDVVGRTQPQRTFPVDEKAQAGEVLDLLAQIRPRSHPQEAYFLLYKRQRRCLLEQLAIEAKQLLSDRRRIISNIHMPPEVGHFEWESAWIYNATIQQFFEAIFPDQTGVLDEHCEQTAHQKNSDGARFKITRFKRFRNFCQFSRDLARNLCRLQCGVETTRLFPHIAKKFTRLGIF
jgi:hypothetical protein